MDRATATDMLIALEWSSSECGFLSNCHCQLPLRLIGNANKLLAPIKDTKVPFFKKQLFVMLNEECLKQRRARLKGTATLHQVEFLYALSREPLNMPERKRQHYDGTNKGDLLGWVALPPWESAWALTFDEKKKLYGKHRVAVGGPTGAGHDDDDDDDDAMDGTVDDVDLAPPTVGTAALPSVPTSTTSRLGTNIEPAFYQAMPIDFYEEVISSMYLRDLIHLTAGDGAGAKAALRLHVNYFGICLTEFHVQALYVHLTEWMLKQFAEPTSPFYQPSMNKRRRAADTPTPAQPATGGHAVPKSAPQPNPKRARTHKDKKNKKAAKSSSSSSSSDDE